MQACYLFGPQLTFTLACDVMIKKTIQEKLKKYSVSSGDSLLGFQIDIDHFLGSSDFFENVSVKKTADPECALLATCSVASGNINATEIGVELKEIWMNYLRYNHWEEHEIVMESNLVKLCFATLDEDEPSSLFVTGEISVSMSS
jgi:hypothetical protein